MEKNMRIKVIGVGITGIEKVEYFFDYNKEKDLENIHYLAVDTDINRLMLTKIAEKILLQDKPLNDDINTIKAILKDTTILFLVTEINQDIAFNWTLNIAKIAKELNIITIIMASKTFYIKKNENAKEDNMFKSTIETFRENIIFEDIEEPLKNNSFRRMLEEIKELVGPIKEPLKENKVPERIKETLKENSDSFIALENPHDNNFIRTYNDRASKIFKHYINMIYTLIFQRGVISLDFEEIKNFLKNSGEIVLSFGRGIGEYKVDMLVDKFKEDSIFSEKLDSSTSIMICVRQSPDSSLGEIADFLTKTVIERKIDNNAILATGVINEWEEEMEIIILRKK